jgi:hypothetical protein
MLEMGGGCGSSRSLQKCYEYDVFVSGPPEDPITDATVIYDATLITDVTMIATAWLRNAGSRRQTTPPRGAT